MLAAAALDMLSLLMLVWRSEFCCTTEEYVGLNSGAAGLRNDEHLYCECVGLGGTRSEFDSSTASRRSREGRLKSLAIAEYRQMTSVYASGARSSTTKERLLFFWKGETAASSVQPSQVRSVASEPEFEHSVGVYKFGLDIES